MTVSLLLATAILIRNVTVIDGTGAPPRPAQDVLIVDGRIAGGRTVPKRASVLDGRGKFLVPGLWDMHVQLAGEEALGEYLRHGVTSIRDMGSDGPNMLRRRDEVAAGRRRGPRIFSCGTPVDGPGAAHPFPVISVSTPAEGFDAAERLDTAQVNFINVLAGVPRDAYFSLAHRARVLRLPFAGQVPKEITIEEAVENRQRSIERLDSFPYPPPEQLVNRMVTFGTRVVPVLAAGPARPEIVAALARARVSLLAGSGGSDPAGLHMELERLVAAGLTPLQAIRSATFEAAHFFGMEDRVGAIQPGRIADLVLLYANPAADIRNLRKISSVIAGGEIVSSAPPAARKSRKLSRGSPRSRPARAPQRRQTR